ncbi:hypothetical protein J6590_099979 [Homalodisca vitripennis]|nr:hypothetical protein J6590_099979 [Homalodisca vitripennis]
MVDNVGTGINGTKRSAYLVMVGHRDSLYTSSEHPATHHPRLDAPQRQNIELTSQLVTRSILLLVLPERLPFGEFR